MVLWGEGILLLMAAVAAVLRGMLEVAAQEGIAPTGREARGLAAEAAAAATNQILVVAQVVAAVLVYLDKGRMEALGVAAALEAAAVAVMFAKMVAQVEDMVAAVAAAV
jgi:hypothetical protein